MNIEKDEYGDEYDLVRVCFDVPNFIRTELKQEAKKRGATTSSLLKFIVGYWLTHKQIDLLNNGRLAPKEHQQ